MKKIAIIASNNGLGHIRRCIFSQIIFSSKFKVDIFSKEKLDKFRLEKKVTFNDFDVNFYKKISQKKTNIHRYFNFKKKFDLYLSDNYLKLAFKNKKYDFIKFFLA